MYLEYLKITLAEKHEGVGEEESMHRLICSVPVVTVLPSLAVCGWQKHYDALGKLFCQW